MRDPWMPCLAPLAMLLLATTARAQEGRIHHPVQLEYIPVEGARVCPPESSLHHMISSRMEKDPFVPSALSKARVLVLRVGSAFQASYELLNDAGEWVGGFTLARRDDCINALEDAGISISAHMPLLLSDPTPPPPSPVEEPAKAPAPAPAVVSPPASPRQDGGGGGGERKAPAKAAHRIVGLFDGGVLASFGTAPMTAFGLFVHVGARLSLFSLSAGARFEFSPPDETNTTRITTAHVLADVASCMHLDVGWGAAFGCGVFQGGNVAITFKGKTLDFSQTLDVPGVALGARVGLQHHFQFLPRGIDLFVAGDVMRPLRYQVIRVRPSYQWDGWGTTGALQLGVVLSPSPSP